jgi:hypothetical protein
MRRDEEKAMTRLVAAAAFVALLGTTAVAHAADVKARPRAVAVAPVVVVQDCSVFYDDLYTRGFAWGSGPGNIGFGTFEGALPRYPDNSFPNWYGHCTQWGHYSAAGSAPRW